MGDITVYKKDGTVERFEHVGRAGGSYTKTAKFKEGWVIIEDEYGKKTAFPSEEVARVEDVPLRY